MIFFTCIRGQFSGCLFIRGNFSKRVLNFLPKGLQQFFILFKWNTNAAAVRLHMNYKWVTWGSMPLSNASVPVDIKDLVGCGSYAGTNLYLSSKCSRMENILPKYLPNNLSFCVVRTFISFFRTNVNDSLMFVDSFRTAMHKIVIFQSSKHCNLYSELSLNQIRDWLLSPSKAITEPLNRCWLIFRMYKAYKWEWKTSILSSNNDNKWSLGFYL